MGVAEFAQWGLLSSGCALIATLVAGAVDLWKGRNGR